MRRTAHCKRVFNIFIRLDNTIKVQCGFAVIARCCVRFAARSRKYARYVFNRAPCGQSTGIKSKISDRRENGIFPVLQGGRTRKYRAHFLQGGRTRKYRARFLQGGRTRKYRAHFKDGNAAKPNNSSIQGALYFDYIV